MRSTTKMLVWFIFLVLPLLVGITLHFATREPTFDYITSGQDVSGSTVIKDESMWMRYGILFEIPWIVVSGLVLFSTAQPKQQTEEPRDEIENMRLKEVFRTVFAIVALPAVVVGTALLLLFGDDEDLEGEDWW